MPKKYININYPFKESPEGFFIDLNDDGTDAIKADLLHLILTVKGQRLYNPEFGTNLLRFIFEPNDETTQVGIQEEIRTVVKTYLPQLDLDEIRIEESPESNHAAIVHIGFRISDAVFTTSDSITIQI
jgi:phage baseplate assembly protein W